MSIKKILVFTGTRADYGIMYWLLKGLEEHADIDLQLLVSGSHLCSQFGSTYKDIEKDGFTITRKVDVIFSGDTPTSVPKSVGIGLLSYAQTLDELQPQAVIILGDRFEAFAMSQAAFFMKIPIVHLHGGEVTQGANDDRMRHAITKLSDLHFTSTDAHRERVIQLGEQPHTVICVGAPGLEHVDRSSFPSIQRLSEIFDFDFEVPYILIAFHPVTNAVDSGIAALVSLFDVCAKMTSFNFVISLSNADYQASLITQEIEKFQSRANADVLVRASFGHMNFLTIIKNATLMLGNSSSGIVEAPSLRTPSIDVGMRQYGRDRANSVCSANGSRESIENAIEQVLASNYSEETYQNPYYQPSCSEFIIKNIVNLQYSMEKIFYDVTEETFQ